MDTSKVSLPSITTYELSEWYYALRWVYQQAHHQCAYIRSKGLPVDYDVTQLEKVGELEQFLKTSWDSYIDDQNNFIDQLLAGR